MKHESPLLQLVDQLYPRGASVDVATEVAKGLERVGLHGLVTRSARVAITAGSRGIADLPAVLHAAVVAVRAAGGDPFVVPCMGSHGGATAAGQRAVLEDLGVTEATVGAPVVSSMDVVPVGESAFGAPVWASRDLAEADGVIVVNRVKPHTDFRGEVESGLVKMLVIGAGKHAGALSAHNLTVRHGFPPCSPTTAPGCSAACRRRRAQRQSARLARPSFASLEAAPRSPKPPGACASVSRTSRCTSKRPMGLLDVTSSTYLSPQDIPAIRR